MATKKKPKKQKKQKPAKKLKPAKAEVAKRPTKKKAPAKKAAKKAEKRIAKPVKKMKKPIAKKKAQVKKMATNEKKEVEVPTPYVPHLPRREVDLVTSDGVHIKADFYDDMATEKSAILIPMLGRTKDTLIELAESIHAKGYKSLALDPRGHGRSQMNWQSFTSQDFNNITKDIRAAKDYLSAHGAKKVSIIGVSIGANLALTYAVTDSDIKTVILLSPGLDFRGVRPESAVREMKRPILIVASEDDSYSYESAYQLKRTSGAEDTKLETYKDAGHGTEMFRKKEIFQLIIDWLEKHVK